MKHDCFVCGKSNQRVLDEYHPIPPEYKGGDIDIQKVTLCANCKTAVRKIYDEDFFERLEAHTPSQPKSEIVESVLEVLTENLDVKEDRSKLNDGKYTAWIDHGNSSGRKEVPNGADVVWVKSSSIQEALDELGADKSKISTLSYRLQNEGVIYSSSTVIGVSSEEGRNSMRAYPFHPDQLTRD